MERQAGTLWSHWDTVLFREVRQRGHQTLAEGNGAGGMGIAAGDNFIEAPFAGRETEWVGVEGAGMNGFAGNNFSHRRFGAAERGERSAATNGFAQNSEVGLEAVVTLGTRSAEAKTSDRFISDHHDAIAITKFANGGHEAGDRFDAAGVAQGGLKDDGRDLALERIDPAPEMLGIVPSGDHEFLGDFRDNALAGMHVRGIFRIIPGGGRIGETGETFIAPAVIMTLKTKNERATGGGAGEAEGGHDGLGGTVVESYQINRGDHGLDAFGDLDFELALGGPVNAKFGLGADRVGESGGSVTVEQGSLAELVVDGFVAIDIPDTRAGTFCKIDRHRLFHFADATVDTAGDAFLRASEEFLGFGKGCGHGDRSSKLGDGSSFRRGPDEPLRRG